jgi:hypothetical protein
VRHARRGRIFAQGYRPVQVPPVMNFLDENMETLSKRYPPSGIAFHPTRPLLAVVMPNGDALRIMDVSTLA